MKAYGWDDANTYTRVIDGDPDGVLTVAENRKLNFNYYSAGYQVDKNTIVHIESWLPMDGGTGDLLNTIHVAEASSDHSMTEKFKRDLLSNQV